jgi:hypothetical protein
MKPRYFFVGLAAACTALAAGLTSCPSEDVRTVAVKWRFDGLTCAEAGVQTVHVFIGPLAPEGSYDHEVECEVGQKPDGLKMEGVAPGPHTVVLKGLAADRVLYEITVDLEVPDGDDASIGELNLPRMLPPP